MSSKKEEAKTEKKSALTDLPGIGPSIATKLEEAAVYVNGSPADYREGKLLQEALFLRHLTRRKRWRKLRWKVELADQKIVLWPDAISEGKDRHAISIQMQWTPSFLGV